MVFTGDARAQTVADIAARGACSTAGLEGISRQLADSQTCIRPGQFVRFAPHPRITLSSSRVHPYLQASARDAVHRVADGGTSLTINSAFRTLADQYVLYHSGGCGLAATPGRSNHQSGRAIDVGSYSSVRSALEGAGCAWLGSRDPVHFDCPGSDLRSDAILTFQRLWNANNPGDRIAEDGVYGPQTESRLGRTPAAGFGTDLCAESCERHCEGDVLVDAECGRGDCGAFGATCADDALGVRCVSVFCPATGEADVCLDERQRAHCSDGAIGEPTECPEETSCAGEGECVPAAVPIDMGTSDERDAGASTTDASVAPPVDGGSDPLADDPGFSTATGGCSCGVPGGSSPAGGALSLLLLAGALRRRR
jgi:MYXO-CTERM domain-containing protein